MSKYFKQEMVFCIIFILSLISFSNCGKDEAAGGYTAREVIQYLDLKEYSGICGGYYREVYRSDITLDQEGETFNAASMIYHLIQDKDFTPWRKYTADEIFFYLAGTPHIICYITPEGQFVKNIVGNDLQKGQVPMLAVPAGSWLSSVLSDRSEGSWGLVGLFVVPGWTPDIFENRSSDEFFKKYPHLEEMIRDAGLVDKK